MDRRIPKIAGAILPEPMPVVVKMVFVERTRRRRPEPEIVVDARWHLTIGGNTDRIAQTTDHRPSRIDRSQSSFTQELLGLCDHSAAASLSADRNDPVVSARCLDHSPALDDVVADG